MIANQQIVYLPEKLPTAEEPTIIIRMIRQREALKLLLGCMADWKQVFEEDEDKDRIINYVFEDIAMRVLGFTEEECTTIFGLNVSQMHDFELTNAARYLLSNRYHL